jgi:hypothetical protein
MSTGRKLLPAWFPSQGGGAAARPGTVFRRRRPQTFGLGLPPDADSLAEAFEVEKRAKADGSNDLPPTSEEIIAGTQGEIVDYHRKLQAGTRRKLDRLAARLTAATRRIDVAETVDRLRDIPSKCRNKVNRTAAEFVSRLALLREQEAEQRQRLDESSAQDGDGDSGHVAWKAIYFVLMLAMAGVASFALGSASVWGVDSESLLRADLAIAIAVIAVVVPFLIAFSVSSPISERFDRERPVFRMAIFLTTICLALLAYFCAHLIVVSAGSPDSPAANVMIAVTSMTAAPEAIATDFNAWIGFCIVIVMGLLGFLLGNQSVGADAESGGARGACLRVRRERDELTSRLRKQINDIVDAAEKDANRSAARLRSRVRKLSTLAVRAKHTEAYFDNYLAGLEESCNLLLERYREANVAMRSTEAPPSFSEQVCFRLDGASRPRLFEDGIERYRKIDSEMVRFSGVLARVRQDLRNLNSEAIKDIDIAALPAEELPQNQEASQAAY